VFIHLSTSPFSDDVGCHTYNAFMSSSNLLVYSFVFFFFWGGGGGGGISLIVLFVCRGGGAPRGVKFVLHRLSMGVSQNFLDVKGYET